VENMNREILENINEATAMPKKAVKILYDKAQEIRLSKKG